nr:F-box protein At5g39250 [Ipomoea batatas]
MRIGFGGGVNVDEFLQNGDLGSEEDNVVRGFLEELLGFPLSVERRDELFQRLQFFRHGGVGRSSVAGAALAGGSPAGGSSSGLSHWQVATNATFQFMPKQLATNATFQIHGNIAGTNTMHTNIVGLDLSSSVVVPKMSCEEILKAVFPFLEGTDLATCMLVCKQWCEIAQDDYFWKCLCAKKWPSLCKRPSPPTVTYYKLFQTFYKHKNRRIILPPRLSFNELEFYIDIWADDKIIFSEVVPGPVLQKGTWIPPPGICDVLRFHLEGPEYKMTLPVEPRFTVPLSQTVSVSVLVGRKDKNKVACIINKSIFDYVDRTAYRALAYDYLEFSSPVCLFVSGIRAWISLLFMDHGTEGASDVVIDVFGIEMDFCDAANSEEEVLWLLDMLDWK